MCTNQDKCVSLYLYRYLWRLCVSLCVRVSTLVTKGHLMLWLCILQRTKLAVRSQDIQCGQFDILAICN